MPGLILFRRRWAIASDDLVFPSIGETCLRISWLIILIVIFCIHHGSFECHHGYNLKAFYIGTLVLNSICLINVIALLWKSMQGTISNGSSRQNIHFFLYAKLLLLIPECVWVCLSTYWAFGYSYTCDWTAVWTVRGCVICSWAVGFVMFVMFVIIFDPLGSMNERYSVACSMNRGGDEHVVIGSLSAQKVWETRCRFLCCCIACNPDTQQAFTDVSKLVADFFHDVDVVPTDIAAGLILVQKQQALSSNQLTAVIVEGNENEHSIQNVSPDDGLLFTQPKSWMTIKNMAHYMKYAMGSYGWPFYMYEYLGTGLCRLSPACTVVRDPDFWQGDLIDICCSCIRSANGVYQDNVCRCNTAAIKKLSGACDDDLIYVTFHNKFKEIPFYVAIDRETKAVVISIRGTLSLHDALTDVSARGVPLEIPNVEDSFCHSAMLDCAMYIKTQIETLNLLESAFAHICGEVDLVVTGHSLGAGVASILAVLLRPSYPDLQCFAFSPPGGLMSPNASKYSQEFICSVIVGKDLVPRLGMYTLADLKVKMLRAIIESREPKYRILAAGCLRLLCCSQPQEDNSPSMALVRERQTHRYTEARILEDALRMAELHAEEVLKTEWPLHPAGQILHIVDMNEDLATCCEEPQYCALWTSAESFDKIVISHKMVADHFPNVVNSALEQLKERNYTPKGRHLPQLLHHSDA